MDNKRNQIAIVGIITAVICGVLIGYSARKESLPPAEVMEPVSGISASVPQIKKPRYLLSQHDGKLAVFIIGKKEPELVFDRFLHYLPDVDRMKLQKGIEVYDYSELLRLIEDYTS